MLDETEEGLGDENWELGFGVNFMLFLLCRAENELHAYEATTGYILGP